MAVVWTTKMTVGVNPGGGGYIEGSLGTLEDTSANMYGGATCQRLFFTSSTNAIELRFAGNVSGGWVSCKLGVLYFQYSDFTRVYNGTYTSFTLTVASNPFRYITPAPTTPMTITFYNTSEGDYGINVFGTGVSKGVTWSSQSRYTNILRTGTVSVPASGSAGPYTATGIGSSGATLLVFTNSLYADKITYTTTTNSFTLFNSHTVSISVSYLALRT